MLACAALPTLAACRSSETTAPASSLPVTKEAIIGSWVQPEGTLQLAANGDAVGEATRINPAAAQVMAMAGLLKWKGAWALDGELLTIRIGQPPSALIKVWRVERVTATELFLLDHSGPLGPAPSKPTNERVRLARSAPTTPTPVAQ